MEDEKSEGEQLTNCHNTFWSESIIELWYQVAEMCIAIQSYSQALF